MMQYGQNENERVSKLLTTSINNEDGGADDSTDLRSCNTYSNINNSTLESETEPNELDKPSKEANKLTAEHSMTAFEAGLALLSAIVGGGIVGIPFAMFHTGIPLGIVLNIGIAVAGWYTGTLYLKVKDMSPTYVESLYELGFVTMGAASIYVISVVVLISGVGCTMIYFIVFSKISASLAQ